MSEEKQEVTLEQAERVRQRARQARMHTFNDELNKLIQETQITLIPTAFLEDGRIITRLIPKFLED